MYYIPSAIYVAATVIFLIFSSGETQKFDSKKYKKKYCFLLWIKSIRLVDRIYKSDIQQFYEKQSCNGISFPSD